MRITDKYVFFFSYKDIFSNHYSCPRPFFLPKHKVVGAKFHTVEHFMMYEKAILFGDHNIAVDIANAGHPQEAKLLGRKVKNFDNSKWEAFREEIVVSGLYAKMMANESIKKRAVELYKKGLIFVEASPYDAVYGVKLAENDPLIDDPKNWKGINLLGQYWHKAIERVLSIEEDH